MRKKPMAILSDGLLTLLEYLAEYTFDDELKKYLMSEFGVTGKRIAAYYNATAAFNKCDKGHRCGQCQSFICAPYKDDSLLFEIMTEILAYRDGRLDMDTGEIADKYEPVYLLTDLPF